MALRLTTLKRAAVQSRRMLESRSFSHVSAIDRLTASPSLVLPEFYQDQSDSIDDKEFQFQFRFLEFLFRWIHGANGCAQEEGVVEELSCHISTAAAVSEQYLMGKAIQTTDQDLYCD